MQSKSSSLAAAGIVVAIGGATLFGACAAHPPTAAPSSSPASTPRAARIACGSLACRAHDEMCCLAGGSPRCIAVPPRSANAPAGDAKEDEREADTRWRACDRSTTFRLCDDAGDCSAGETCCGRRVLESDGRVVPYSACVRLTDARATCQDGELCSEDDRRCAHAGSVCDGHVCSAARRGKPSCGGKPCADGMTCVDAGAGRSCVPGVLRFPEHEGVIECDVGSDCAADEGCFTNPQASGTRCDHGYAGVDPTTEFALCAQPADCAGFCKNGPASSPRCWSDAGSSPTAPTHCECFAHCTKDEDCGPCTTFELMRGVPSLERTCDRASGTCDCRPPHHAP